MGRVFRRKRSTTIRRNEDETWFTPIEISLNLRMRMDGDRRGDSTSLIYDADNPSLSRPINSESAKGISLSNLMFSSSFPRRRRGNDIVRKRSFLHEFASRHTSLRPIAKKIEIRSSSCAFDSSRCFYFTFVFSLIPLSKYFYYSD